MDDYSPYKSPEIHDEAAKLRDDADRPAVLLWCKVYLGFMTGLYLVGAVVGVLLLAFAASLADPETDAMEFRIMGAVYGVLGVLFGIGFGIGLLVPRRRWGWIYTIVLICIGFTSCCTLPACIPLLIFWIKPETKMYFGMSP